MSDPPPTEPQELHLTDEHLLEMAERNDEMGSLSNDSSFHYVASACRQLVAARAQPPTEPTPSVLEAARFVMGKLHAEDVGRGDLPERAADRAVKRDIIASTIQDQVDAAVKESEAALDLQETVEATLRLLDMGLAVSVDGPTHLSLRKHVAALKRERER